MNFEISYYNSTNNSPAVRLCVLNSRHDAHKLTAACTSYFDKHLVHSFKETNDAPTHTSYADWVTSTYPASHTRNNLINELEALNACN